jgi:hypothetical protein
MDNSWTVSEIQENMAKRLMRDQETNRTIDLLSIMQGMVTDKFGRISKSVILLEAQQAGFSEDEFYQVLDICINNNTLKEDGDYVYFLK